MPPSASQPLFGRERERAELLAALVAAESGKGALALLVGEPGIGKTRLANEFASEAAARGAQVTWGRAWEAGGAPAYWPWVEAMRPFASVAQTATDAERARIAPLARVVFCRGHVDPNDERQDRCRHVQRRRPQVIRFTHEDVHIDPRARRRGEARGLEPVIVG